MTPGPDLIVFAEDWGAHPSSTQHLVSRLAVDGRRVLWINSIGLRQPRLAAADAARAASKLVRAIGGRAASADARRGPFPVVQPLVLPMATSRAARMLNRRLLATRVGAAARAAGLRDPVLWTSLPSAVDAVGTLGESAVVYYCGDDFGALAGVDHRTALAMEAELARAADLAIVAHPANAAKLSAAARVEVLPHGVDFDLFSVPVARADDLPTGAPVAGFYGALAPWIDTGLVAATAALLPEWRFLLIGPIQADVSALGALPNVTLAGPRPHARLPSYSQHWQAGLVPFLDNAQIRAADPLKLREYLAAGRPVVSTPFPALARYAQAVRAVRTPSEMAAALVATLDEPNGSDTARRAMVADEGWDVRAATLSGLLASLPGRRRPA